MWTGDIHQGLLLEPANLGDGGSLQWEAEDLGQTGPRISQALPSLPWLAGGPLSVWMSGDSITSSVKSGQSLGASVAVFVEPKWRLSHVLEVTSVHPFCRHPSPLWASLPSNSPPTCFCSEWAPPCQHKTRTVTFRPPPTPTVLSLQMVLVFVVLIRLSLP